MNKLRLHIDDLQVESFRTLNMARCDFGTVHARQGAALPLWNAGTDASNCATCDTCVGDNCRTVG